MRTVTETGSPAEDLGSVPVPPTLAILCSYDERG